MSGQGTSDRPADAPRGEITLQTIAMPADSNANGDIFGGWLMAQMDLGASVLSRARARGRVATVAVDAMVFHKPVYVGDVLCTYADIIRVGRTSIAIHIEAWALRSRQGERVKVTQGTFTLVAIDDVGRPRPVPPEGTTAQEEPAA